MLFSGLRLFMLLDDLSMILPIQIGSHISKFTRDFVEEPLINNGSSAVLSDLC